MKLEFAILAALFTAGCTTVPQEASQPSIAITIDDLPVHGPYPRGESEMSATKEILAALQAEQVEAYGFLNAQWTERQPATAEALEAWAAAGQPLANHGFAHRHLSEMSAEEFEQELVKNEPVLERLSGGKDWKWFRYPFLDEGENPEKRAASRAVLAKHGYKIAAVTMDFSDWAWSAPYARCKDAGDDAAVARLEALYLQAARESIAHYRALSQQTYGRDISYVLLLHVSAFEGRMLPQLLRLYRNEGFRFTTLVQAQSDAAYLDQNEPQRPAEPQGLEGKATERGPLPTRTDYQPILEGICKA
jgi:peptidoglycan/xylan/chitin deacetylase (PgdA/CDA1 family)